MAYRPRNRGTYSLIIVVQLDFIERCSIENQLDRKFSERVRILRILPRKFIKRVRIRNRFGHGECVQHVVHWGCGSGGHGQLSWRNCLSFSAAFRRFFRMAVPETPQMVATVSSSGSSEAGL